VVFHRIMEQGGAHDVGIADPVVAGDPDGYPQQVTQVGFTLPPVADVQARSQAERSCDAISVGICEGFHLCCETFSKTGLAVDSSDRVQWHCGQQPALAGAYACLGVRTPIAIRGRFVHVAFIRVHRTA
jgi:hypothetical protein